MAVQLDDIDVLYVPSAAGVAGAAAAMACVEAALPTLRGRRFYGVCYDPEDDFRACVAIGPGDDVAPGLHRGVIPGGHYAKAKVRTSDEIAKPWRYCVLSMSGITLARASSSTAASGRSFCTGRSRNHDRGRGPPEREAIRRSERSATHPMAPAWGRAKDDDVG